MLNKYGASWGQQFSSSATFEILVKLRVKYWSQPRDDNNKLLTKRLLFTFIRLFKPQKLSSSIMSNSDMSKLLDSWWKSWMISVSSCSNARAIWNYHQLSWPFERGLSLEMKKCLDALQKKQWSRFSISKILSYWCCSYRLKKSFRYIAEIGLWQISGFSFSAAKNIINRASECVSFGFSFHILVLFPSIKV